MLAVPALALAGQWPLAAGLVVAERIGRGIRKPTVEAMLSYAGKSIGAGWVFGLNEALDQAGATIGPLLMALVLYLNGGYRTGFGVLLIPALLCLGILVMARLLHPRPHELEEGAGHLLHTNLTRTYWIYLAAGGLIAAGFADFALIGFHFHKGEHRAGKFDSCVLRSRNGSQRACIDPFRPAYLTGSVQIFLCSPFSFLPLRAVCFSGHIESLH